MVKLQFLVNYFIIIFNITPQYITKYGKFTENGVPRTDMSIALFHWMYASLEHENNC